MSCNLAYVALPRDAMAWSAVLVVVFPGRTHLLFCNVFFTLDFDF